MNRFINFLTKGINLGGNAPQLEHTYLYHKGFSHSARQHAAYDLSAQLLPFWTSLFQ